MSKVETDKTIESVVKAGLCVGCGTCAGVCPKDAIEMVVDHRQGVYLPRLDKDKCNECRLCYDVCPGHSVDFKRLNEEVFGHQPEDVLLANYLNCYTGYATDYEIRYNSASGGLATALLIFALEQGIIDGALVTKMNTDNPLKPQPFIARTREEITSAAKSKYCPVPANIALREIIRAKEGERFAVVGLPCHIHGLRKAEALDKKLALKIGLHLGLFCSHPMNFWGTEFILHSYGVEPAEIDRLDYRGEGWPGYMSIRFKNGGKKLVLMGDYIIFHNLGFFTPVRCALCCDQLNDFADISLGDAWLLEVMQRDSTGTSLVISRSGVGESLLEQIKSKGEIVLESVSRERAFTGTKRDNLRAKFFLNRLIGKQIPTYQVQLGRPKLVAYPYYLLRYLNMYLSSKRRLWWLIGPLARLEKAAMGLVGGLMRLIGLRH